MYRMHLVTVCTISLSVIVLNSRDQYNLEKKWHPKFMRVQNSHRFYQLKCIGMASYNYSYNHNSPTANTYTCSKKTEKSARPIRK